MDEKKYLIKFVIIITLAILLPIITYTTYSFMQKNKDEQLIQQIYNQQLESILFSVNQYCWAGENFPMETVWCGLS